MKKSYHFYTMRVENICNAKPKKIRIKINKKKEILTLEIFIFDRQISNMFLHLFQVCIHFGFWNELLFLTRLVSDRNLAQFWSENLCLAILTWSNCWISSQVTYIHYWLHSWVKNSNWIKNLICFRLHCCCRSTLCFEFQGNKNR